jgi:hypothetical protein
MLELVASAPLPPRQQAGKINSSCIGANILVYTGANSSFANCPPYSGKSEGVSTTMLRAVLGGSPGSTGATPSGSIPAGPSAEPSVQIPLLAAICSSETTLWQQLTGQSQVPSTALSPFANWLSFLQQAVKADTAFVPNYFTLDVTIVELPLDGSQQVFCIIRGVPYVP